MNTLVVVAITLVSFLALQQAHAHFDTPSEQLRSGVLPEDVLCNDNLILVILHDRDPACVRPATAERLGLEPLRGESVAYMPPDMTKANPNIKITHVHATVGYSHISQYAHDIVYTLEGTVTAIKDPIIRVPPSGLVSAGIPIVISVDKVHKGNLESNEFTFFITAWAVIVDGYAAASATSLGREPFPYPSFFREFTATEIKESTDTKYLIGDTSDQYEVGNNVIVHLSVDEHVEQTLSAGTSVMISDGSITPYYSTPLGKESAYQIQNGVVFDHAGFAKSYDIVTNESRSIE